MKKLFAILLTAVMAFGCLSAVAETAGPSTVRFVESSPDFDITMPLPEGATLGEQLSLEQVSVCTITSGELAPVLISIAPSDIYEKLSMNDLTDDQVEELKGIACEQFESPKVEIDVTPSGNKYIYICEDSEYDTDSIFTLYMGYFVQLSQWRDDYSTVTDEDHAFMLQLLYNIEFTPIK